MSSGHRAWPAQVLALRLWVIRDRAAFGMSPVLVRKRLILKWREGPLADKVRRSEIAPHSITSSARNSTSCGTLIPSVWPIDDVGRNASRDDD
jgi:hypothetical protein